MITRIYRELKKLNSPKINEPIQKWATELNSGQLDETDLFQRKKSKKHMKNAHHPWILVA
jgi:hypothetical protein